MVKYRLKKDLPNIDAGQEIGVEDFNRQTLVISRNCIEYYIPKSKKDLWIEEVQPREFYLGFKTNSTNRSYPAFSKTGLEESGLWDEIIKVREVI